MKGVAYCLGRDVAMPRPLPSQRLRSQVVDWLLYRMNPPNSPLAGSPKSCVSNYNLRRNDEVDHVLGTELPGKAVLTLCVLTY